MSFPSFELENESFVLKGQSIVFSSRFISESFLLIYHIHIAGPLLFILLESEIVLMSLR